MEQPQAQQQPQPKRGALVMANQIGEVTVVNFLTTQVLDEMNVHQLGEELNNLVDKEGKTKLVLNFTKVKYLSSAVLGKLISLNKKVNGLKGRIGLCGINPEIMKVFKITQLDKMIPIFESEEDAVKGIAKPGLFGRYL